jgi:hypothetical protein
MLQTAKRTTASRRRRQTADGVADACKRRARLDTAVCQTQRVHTVSETKRLQKFQLVATRSLFYVFFMLNYTQKKLGVRNKV